MLNGGDYLLYFRFDLVNTVACSFYPMFGTNLGPWSKYQTARSLYFPENL
jgi:hypothetical protein